MIGYFQPAVVRAAVDTVAGQPNQLSQVVREVVEERCNRCGILMEELFNGYFNLQWIKHWVRSAMPIEIDSEDYRYQVMMYDCRNEFLRRL